ncbi:MAG: VanZ family protein [Epsilonproteobacteria bacterium]|nr:VanZ family protein [Campylobacterota bacterium]
MSNFFRIFFFIVISSVFYLAFHTFSYQHRPFFYFLINFNDKLNHIVAFVILAFLLEKAYNIKNIFLNGAILLFIGAFIEVYQLFFVPGRSFSLKDFLADVIGISIYFLIKKMYEQRRKRASIYKIENLKYKTLAQN